MYVLPAALMICFKNRKEATRTKDKFLHNTFLKLKHKLQWSKWKKSQPAGKGSPSSPGSWAWRGQGRPSQKNQSWCSQSLGSSQPSCMCILRGTSCQQRRKVIQLHLDSQPPNHTCNLSKTSVKAHVWTETPVPQIKDKISTVASLWWYAPSIGAVSTNQSILAAFQKVVILYNQPKKEIGKATPLHHCGQYWFKITDEKLRD